MRKTAFDPEETCIPRTSLPQSSRWTQAAKTLVAPLVYGGWHVQRSCTCRAQGDGSILLHDATPDQSKTVRQQRTKFLLFWRSPTTLILLGLKRALVNLGDVEAHLVGPQGSDVLCGHAVAGTRWSGWLQRSRSRTSTGTG